ncbi:siderophore biosynthesis protein SbnG [Cupriavidus necator]|uniref:Siderophore biosynthesis protein SbnG n=1 Tax=Cupriavidus necator TaxID=106590 RepID=A0A1U9UMT2_CUPNE|nr:aldolase/citrate lyase family protein [Cupriavidus necator]AQV93889.1 siderophore biosynthesis protein SbnG [Cupriavidus necator]
MRSLKARLSDPGARPVHGLFCSTPAALTVELIAAAGYDFVVIDLEHTLIDGAQLNAMLLAARASNIAALVRVGAPHQVAPALDAGAEGIVFPRIGSVTQAQQAARLCHYAQHPQLPGERGLNATCHSAFGRDDLAAATAAASADTLVVAMIEDGAALNALDDIAAEPGIDVLLEGAADLSQALGVPWQTRHPLVQDAVARIAAAAGRHGKHFCALPRTPEDATQWRRQGAHMQVLGDDRGIARRAMAAHLHSHSQSST